MVGNVILENDYLMVVFFIYGTLWCLKLWKFTDDTSIVSWCSNGTISDFHLLIICKWRLGLEMKLMSGTCPRTSYSQFSSEKQHLSYEYQLLGLHVWWPLLIFECTSHHELSYFVHSKQKKGKKRKKNKRNHELRRFWMSRRMM